MSLNKQHILDLQPGPELDALVAEKIMGYIVRDKDMLCMVDWEEDGLEVLRPFNPSERINDAWEVAEKKGIAIIPQSDKNGFRWYACDLESASYRSNIVIIKKLNDSGVSCTSAQEAICKAALLATLKR